MGSVASEGSEGVEVEVRGDDGNKQETGENTNVRK